MNTQKTGLTIVLMFYLLFFHSFSWAAENITLEKALSERKIQVDITGMGGSTGDTILLSIKRKIPKKLRISLSPGTVFKSKTGNVQNMVGSKIKGERIGPKSYRPTSEIYLNNDRKRSYIIEAYCLDFNKPNPGIGDAFTISNTDDRTKKIIIEGEKAKYSTRIIQSAIWIDRANATSSQLKSRFTVNDDDIETAKRLLNKINTTSQLGKTKYPDKERRAKNNFFTEKKLSLFLPNQFPGFIASKQVEFKKEQDSLRAIRTYNGKRGIWAWVAIDTGSKARERYNRRITPKKIIIHNYNAVWDLGANNAVALFIDIAPEIIVWTIVFNTENRELALDIIDKIDLNSISKLSNGN